MFVTLPNIGLIFCAIVLASIPVEAREKWLERNNRPVYLYPRRFGQEQPAVIQKLSAACSGQVCGVLAGAAITPLLAAQPECSQQDMADDIIDAAAQFDQATQDLMIEIAIEYRQAEKNTPPDFSTNPPTARNSVFCQKAPRNSQLNGLVQAQDPANDPNIFFDPALGASVTLGSQANTAPFGSTGGAAAPAPVQNNDGAAGDDTADPCVSTSTVTVTVDATATAPADTVAAPEATATSISNVGAGNIGDFGSCSVPEIEFAAGFDNRRETSFQPVDKASFNHGSAQNIDIITQAICDTLVNTCGADQTAKDTCATAKAAASEATKGTGEQADAFNAAFGITSNFASVTAVDNKGDAVPGTGSGAGADDGVALVETGAGGVGDFGSCSVPQIEFGAGFDNRKETSFQPADLASFAHGSAQNIDIITRFICDTLTNSCNADQTAKDTCATATAAASGATKATGAQADAFNAAFGITTNFASVTAVDNQGNNVAGSNNDSDNTPATNAGGNANTATTATDDAAPATNAPSNVAASSGANLQTFAAALGGVTPPTVTDLGAGDRPFQVEGNAAFNDLTSALVRSCDVQHNQCANAANSSGNKGDVTVEACGQQQTECIAAAQS